MTSMWSLRGTTYSTRSLIAVRSRCGTSPLPGNIKSPNTPPIDTDFRRDALRFALPHFMSALSPEATSSACLRDLMSVILAFQQTARYFVAACLSVDTRDRRLPRRNNSDCAFNGERWQTDRLPARCARSPATPRRDRRRHGAVRRRCVMPERNRPDTPARPISTTPIASLILLLDTHDESQQVNWWSVHESSPQS